MSEQVNFFALFTSNVHRLAEQYNLDVQSELRDMIKHMEVMITRIDDDPVPIATTTLDGIQSLMGRLGVLKNYSDSMHVLTATVFDERFADEFKKMYGDDSK